MSLAHRIDNGFSTTLSFSLNPTLEFYEVEVQPPGWEGGDPINTTTMRNTLLETFTPASLQTLTEITISAAYTSDIFHLTTGVKEMINKNQEITVTLPDGATFKFWGFIRGWNPPTHTKNVRPMASFRIAPSNTNASKVETLPVFVAAA
jgi:hypothetical protein